MAQFEDITGRYVSVGGTRTYFDECGTGPAVVCVHAAGSDSRQYTYLLPLLAAEGYRVIALDLPGHSRSYPVGWQPLRSCHDHAEFVHRFVAEVCGDERAALVGCSTGGNIVLDLAAHHSADYVAIVAQEGASWTPTFPNPAEMERPSWSPSWRDSMERAAMGALGSVVTDPGKVEELRWLHRGAQDAACGDLQGWSTHDVRGLLGDVRCPVLLIKGMDDFWLPVELVERTAAEIGPACEVRLMEGLGHYPMFEDPDRVAREVAGFLARATVTPRP